ncbi:MAG: tetratricopeptide repeat protein, partial [Deltaproteobacteria bacterium]|nr:tetratricopeptide repeat protein [Deltaproteobacteria bacterium]
TERRAGRYPKARQAIDAAQEVLTGVDYEPVHAEHALEHSRVLDGVGEHDAALATVTKAVEFAALSRQWELLRQALAKRMFIIGVKQHRPEQALHDWPLVLALAGSDPGRRAAARSQRSSILRVQGKYAEAEQELRAALAVQVETPQVHPMSVADTRNRLGAVLQLAGRPAEAETELRAGLELVSQSLEPDHLHVLTIRNNLGNVLHSQGKYEQALVQHRASVDSEGRVLGVDNPRTARARVNLGGTLISLHRYEEAEVELNSALTALEEAYGADYPGLGLVHSKLAHLEAMQGRYTEALTHGRAAVDITEKAHGPRHPTVGARRGNLGSIFHQQGRLDEAEVELRAALSVTLEALGLEHPGAAEIRVELAAVLMKRDDYQQVAEESRIALAHLSADTDPEVLFTAQRLRAESLLALGQEQEAVTFTQEVWDGRQDDEPPQLLGARAFLLSRVLWNVEEPARDRHRARTLAQAALGYYQTAGDEFEDQIREIEQWSSTVAANR